jgi:uncharacterized membrane protein
MDTRRMEAFSDGVFAVAITVLVFNLLPIGAHPKTPPGLTANDLVGKDVWPQYAAYVVSFLTIGIMWMNHHTILSHVQWVDRRLLVLNLLLLLGVVAIPFPTALVAEHLQHPGGGLATVTYGLVMIFISLGFDGVSVYVATHGEKLGTVVPREAMLRSLPGFTAGLAAYIAATLIAAFASPVAALGIYGALAVYYLFEHLPSPRGERETG